MHGFSNADTFLMLAFLSVVFSMTLWWRDVISEGRIHYLNSILSIFYILNITRAIHNDEVKVILNNNPHTIPLDIKDDKFGFYLAGLLEGDGHISLPFLGKTTLNRILNPRIIFTAHVNDLPLYAYIQSKLGGIGRFQLVGNDNIRYIIGDKQGIIYFINLVHGKFRTPKNETFNHLIEFFNTKYSLSLLKSNLDESNILENSWLTGFTEADGHFGVKIVEAKPKSEGKRSISHNISLKFRLDQRLIDKMTSLPMSSIMLEIANSLSCEVKTYNAAKNSRTTMLSLTVTAVDKLTVIINYFDKYPLLGLKGYNYNDWKKVYAMIISKQHLTTEGRTEIKLIQSNMNSRRTYTGLSFESK